MTASKTISYSKEVQFIFDGAEAVAKEYNQSAVDTECLLLSLLKDSRACSLINAANAFVSINGLKQRIEKTLSSLSKAPDGTVPVFTNRFNTIRDSVEKEASASGSSLVSPDHVLLGILRHPNFGAGIILTFYGLSYAVVAKSLAKLPPFATSYPAAGTASTGCGNNCGCSAKTVSSVEHPNQTINSLKNLFSSVQDKANTAANLVGSAIDKASYRAEWHEVLDSAIDLSEKTGLSVSAAFVHVAMTRPSLMKGETSRQLNREAVTDLIKLLFGITK